MPNIDYQIRIFLLRAYPMPMQEQEYDTNKEYPLHVYLRQTKGADEDVEELETILNNNSWNNITCEKTGLVSLERVTKKGKEFMEYYNTAMNEGYFILTYID